MAVLVKHNETGERFVLVGSGVGAWATSRPSLLFGNLAPAEDETTILAAAVCDAEGRMHWVRTEELTVVSIDGVKPRDALSVSA